MPHLRVLALFAVLLAACGGPSVSDDDDDGDGGDDGDAPGLDAGGVDGAPPPVGDVTVHVRTRDGYEQPDPGAEIFFNAADGTLLGTATPDNLGLAVGQVSEGGSVTVHHGGASLRFWTTVTDVAIGDELWFGRVATTSAQAMSLSFPSAGASNYWAQGPCLVGGGTSTTVNVRVIEGCSSPRTILVTTDTLADSHQYLTAELTPVIGGAVTITGTWADGVAATANVTGVPAGAGTVGASVHPTFEHWNGTPLDVTVTPGSPHVLGFVAPPAHPTIGLRFDVRYGFPGTFVSTTHLPTLPAGPITIDAAPLIPRVIAMADDAGGVTWTVTGSGEADAIKVMTSQPAAGLDTLEWTFVLPPAATRVDYPDVPGAPSAAQVDAVSIHGNDVTSSWDQVRPRAGYFYWAGAVPPSAPASYIEQASILR